MLRESANLSIASCYRAIAIVVLILLAGCSAVPKTGQTTDTKKEPPVKDTIGNALLESERAGNYTDAAQEYRRLAAETQGQQRVNFQLQQAAVLLRGNQLEAAAAQLHEIDTVELGLSQQAYKAFLMAQVSMFRQQPAEAMRVLESVTMDNFSLDIRPKLLLFRARVLFALGRYGDMLTERLLLEPLLDEEGVIQNRQQLWQNLMSMPFDDLEVLTSTEQAFVSNGWLELAWIIRKYSVGSGNALSELFLWQEHYPDHPAMESIAQTLVDREQLMIKPNTVAVLLPESGALATIAKVLRKGLLEAYYTDGEPRPRLRFYNVNEATDVRSVYLKAVNEGADIVLGPLDKAQVSKLSTMRLMPVPLLALNSLDGAFRWPKNLYRYGLFPEDEIKQMTAEAIRDGYEQVLLIRPQSAWGERMESYLDEQQIRQGIQVVGKVAYKASDSDFSLPIKRLMHIDRSEERKAKLRRQLGINIRFVPRKRADVDAIFMVAQPKEARAIRPQLLFHYAADLPVYATSHIYQVSADRVALRDVDDTFFMDIPWGKHGDSQVWERIKKLSADEKDLARFYVFGMDAYALLPYLHYLQTHPGEFYAGYSGRLSIDKASKVHRGLLAWEVRNGRVNLKPQVRLYP